MAAAKPWGGVDPNSTHQRWSRWTCVIQTGRRTPSVREVGENWRRFVPRLFRTTVGQVRTTTRQGYYAVTAIVEGPDVHDPAYQASVRRQVEANFVRSGFGSDARLVTMEAALLAGSDESGRPALQLIVLPAVIA